MAKLVVGVNDLATCYPEIAKEWHPTKNGELKPCDVTYGSGKKVWWLFPCDDPKTGKHFDFEWEAVINNRTSKNIGCPFLSNQAVWPDYNDLFTINPELATQWNYSKNKGINPHEIAPNSNKKVWWIMNYNDPITKKTFVFEWEASVRNRAKTPGCPFLSGRRVWYGFNDLETINSEVAKEWHHTKNNNLTPKDVSYASGLKVWWKCKYGHEWIAPVYQRTTRYKTGCPYCAKKKSFPEQALFYYIRQVFYDAKNGDTEKINKELDIFIPSLNIAIEYDGYAWHKDSYKRDNEKNQTCIQKDVQLIRIRENGLHLFRNCICIVREDLCTHMGLNKCIKEVLMLLDASIDIDVDVERDEKEILKEYFFQETNNSILIKNPEQAKYWHPSKNGELFPSQIRHKSNVKFWWQCEKLHEWEATPNSFSGCPYCANVKIKIGYNDLATTHPEILTEWDYYKNEVLPTQVVAGSNISIWWKCIKCDYEWNTSVSNRTKKNNPTGCPKCARKRVEHSVRKKVRCIETEKIFNSISEAAIKMHVNKISITQCCKGKYHTAGGYHWEYV